MFSTIEHETKIWDGQELKFEVQKLLVAKTRALSSVEAARHLCLSLQVEGGLLTTTTSPWLMGLLRFQPCARKAKLPKDQFQKQLLCFVRTLFLLGLFIFPFCVQANQVGQWIWKTGATALWQIDNTTMWEKLRKSKWNYLPGQLKDKSQFLIGTENIYALTHANTQLDSLATLWQTQDTLFAQRQFLATRGAFSTKTRFQM